MTTPRANTDNKIDSSTDNIKFCSSLFNVIKRVNPNTPIYEKIEKAIKKQIEIHTTHMVVKNLKITQFYFKTNPIIIELTYTKDFFRFKLTFEFSDQKAVFTCYADGWGDDWHRKTITVENNTLKPKAECCQLEEPKEELQKFLSYIDSADLRSLLLQPLPPVPPVLHSTTDPYQYEEKFVTETLTENGCTKFLHSIYDIIQSVDKETRQFILNEILNRIKAHYNSDHVVFKEPIFDNNQIIIKYYAQINADESYEGSLEFGPKIAKFQEKHEFGSGSRKIIFEKIISVTNCIEISRDFDGARYTGRNTSESLRYLKKFFSDFKLDTIPQLAANQFSLIPVQSQCQEALPEYPAPDYQETLPRSPTASLHQESPEPSAPPYSSKEYTEDDLYIVHKPTMQQRFPEPSAPPLPPKNGNSYQEYAGVQCILLPEYNKAPGWWAWLTFQTRTVHIKQGQFGSIIYNGQQEFLGPGIYHLPSTTQWFWTRIANWWKNWIGGRTVKTGEMGLPSSVEWVGIINVNDKKIHHDSITIANTLLAQDGNVESDVSLDKEHVIDSPTMTIRNSFDEASRAEREAADTRNVAPYLRSSSGSYPAKTHSAPSAPPKDLVCSSPPVKKQF